MPAASNAFQRLNRYLMLWTVFHRWQQGSRFAFNRYRHYPLIFIRMGQDTAAKVLVSREGVAQGWALRCSYTALP